MNVQWQVMAIEINRTHIQLPKPSDLSDTKLYGWVRDCMNLRYPDKTLCSGQHPPVRPEIFRLLRPNI